MQSVVTVQDGVASVVTVVTDRGILQAVAGYHPNFTLILERLGQDKDDESIVDLFDIEATVRNTFNQLTERVTIRGDEVFVDGDSRGGAIAKQILRCVEEGHTDKLDSLVAFIEKVETNPQPHSREQMFDWLDKHQFTLTSTGDIVGYKGVRTDGEGNFTSISSGPAIVDGKEVNGYVPNPIGAVVEMPRSKVAHDPSHGCASGLHVGTYSYARDFARGAVLEVHVNPRDVVSVPTDCGWQKVRTCRYKVVGVVDAQYTSPVIKVDDDQNQDVKVEASTPEPERLPGPFQIGDRVKVVTDVSPAAGSKTQRGYIPRGTLATVIGGDSRYTRVKYDDSGWASEAWDHSRFALADGKHDTRENHKAQKRYPSGTYRNGENVSGRFIPKHSLDYSRY